MKCVRKSYACQRKMYFSFDEMEEGREHFARSCAAGMRENATPRLKRVPPSRVKGGGEMVAILS